jgi:rubrerythrin
MNHKEEQMASSNLLDAIRVVKENERIASESYSNAAKNLSNPFAKELFEHLSEFEKFHLEKLTALEKSLQETGNFIHYEGKVFPLPPIFEIKAAEEPNKKSAMTIISEARTLEQQAQKAYASLAAECPDQQGKEMFNQLSDEEHKHFLLLSEAYWSLNDTGKWKWSRP